MKIRIQFTKNGKIRFIGHRDVGRVFERALRKSRLPVAYSEGFSPRPKVSFGLALPVAYESDAEFLDVQLATPVDLQPLPETLSQNLPTGLAVVAVSELAQGTPSLQEAVTCTEWEIEVCGLPEAEVVQALTDLLSRSEIPHERERKGKKSTVDVRPALLDIQACRPTENGVLISVELSSEQVNLRPAELVSLLSDRLTEGRVRRLHQWTTAEGERQSPLSAPAKRTEECVS